MRRTRAALGEPYRVAEHGIRRVDNAVRVESSHACVRLERGSEDSAESSCCVG